MLSRAPRPVIEPLQQCDNMGPGRYFRDQPRSRFAPPPQRLQPTRPGKVQTATPKPTIGRQTVVDVSASKSSAIPGPGAYEVSTGEHRPTTTRPTMESGTPRFPEPTVAAPPPTRYNIAVGMQPRGGSSKAARTGIPRRPHTSHAPRITFVRQHTPAAIPARQEVFGYDVQLDGTVVKAIPPDPSMIWGAAEQDVSKAYSSVVASRTKGVAWSKQSAARCGVTVHPSVSNPPPTAYNVVSSPGPVKEPAPSAETGGTKERPFLSTEERRCLPVVCDVDGPTPLSYNINSQFNVDKRRTMHIFSSSTKRFTEKPSEVPAPNTYADPRSAFNPSGVPKPEFAISVPFSQGSARFTDPHPITSTPGPMNYAVMYDTRGNPVLGVVPVASAVGKHPPFGASARRSAAFCAENKKRLASTNSASSLQLACSAEQAKAGGRQAGAIIIPPRAKTAEPAPFGSRTNRVLIADHPVETPPPTAYTIAQERKLKKNKASFLSTSARIPAAKLPQAETPAPNVYNPPATPLDRSETKAFTFATGADRFVQRVNDVPPPTSYSLPASVLDSMYKPTHNVTLGAVPRIVDVRTVKNSSSSSSKSALGLVASSIAARRRE